MLRCTSQDNPQDWSARLPSVLSAYRMTKHSSTGVSPNQAMLGRETLLPCALIAAPPQDGPVAAVYCDQFSNAIREAHSLAYLRFLSPITVVVQHANTHKKQTVHVDRLMPCRSENLNEAPDVPEVPVEHQTSSGSATDLDVPSTPLPSVTWAGRIVKTPARYL